MILPRIAKTLSIAAPQKQASNDQTTHRGIKEAMIDIPKLKVVADKWTSEGEFLQEYYNPSSSPFLWSSNPYMNDLMDMKRRLKALNEKGQQESKK